MRTVGAIIILIALGMSLTFPIAVATAIEAPSFMSDIKANADFSRLSEEQLTRLEEYVVQKTEEIRLSGSGGGADVADCSELVPFGSVETELTVTDGPVASGRVIRFEGVVRNHNAFAIMDASLAVRIFRSGEGVAADSVKSVSVLVDDFIAKDGLTIPPSGELPVSFEWIVPDSATAGEYGSTVSILSDDRPIIADSMPDAPIVLPAATFTVSGGGSGAIAFDRNSVTISGENPMSAGKNLLGFDRDETVDISAMLVNPSTDAKDVTVAWELSDIEAGRVSGILDRKTEAARILPGESKRLSYAAGPEFSKGALTRLRAVVQTDGSKSILNVGFVRSGFDHAHIGSTGMIGRPEGKAEMFACVSADRTPIVNDTKVVITVTDDAGNVVAKHEYVGAIVGSSMAIRDIFGLPESSVTTFHMNVFLERDGKVVDTRETAYDCADFSPTLCGNGVGMGAATPAESGSAEGGGRTLAVVLSVAAGAFAVFAGTIVWLMRRRRIGAAVGLLMIGMLMSASSASAMEQTTWTSGVIAGNPLYKSGSSWYLGVNGISASVTYGASLKNDTTGASIANGSSVPVGTVLRFEPKSFNDDDIQWVGNKYRLGFPLLIYIESVLHGYWTPSATIPSGSCDFNNVAGVNILPAIISGSLFPVTMLYFVPLAVQPPAVSIESSGTAGLSCSGLNCTITSPGDVSAKVVFAQTSGLLYYRWAELLTGLLGLCNGSGSPMRESGASADYSFVVPRREIQYDLVATPIPALRLCVNGTERSTVPILYPNDTLSLKTYFDTGSGCSGTDVTAQTTFIGTNAPGDAVSVSGANPNGSVPGDGTRTAAGNYPVAGASGSGQQTSTERITATYPGQPAKTLDVTVWEVCTLDCSDSGAVCKNIKYDKKDSCENVVTDGCTGTRECNANWIEVVPGF